MKLLIATIAQNNPEEVSWTTRSVEKFDFLENIVFDGESRKSVLYFYSKAGIKYVSAPDDGIYSAMNNAIRYFKKNHEYTHLMFLNSGDELTQNACSYLGEIENNISYSFQVISGNYIHSNIGSKNPQRIRLPHPGLVLSRSHIDFLGLYNENYRSAADLDYVNRINFRVRKRACILVEMAPPGSSSSFSSRWESFIIACNHDKLRAKYVVALIRDSLLWLHLR